MRLFSVIFKHRGSGPPSTLATSSINVVCQEMKTALVYGLEDAISKEMAFLFVLNMQQPWKYKEPNLNSTFYGPPTVCKKAILHFMKQD